MNQFLNVCLVALAWLIYGEGRVMASVFGVSLEGVRNGVVLVLIPAVAYLIADILSLRFTMLAYFIMGVAFIILYYLRLSQWHALFLKTKTKLTI